MEFVSLTVLLEYFVAINIIATLLCSMDKSFARNRKRRISERTLLLVSLLGGSPMMYVSMRVLRHKTHHKRFMVGLPVMMVGQAALVAFVYILL